MRRAIVILVSLSVLAVLVLAVSSLCGSTGCMPVPDVNEMIWQLRAPRVLAAFAVGGLLALAGALMQVLLRNPLADPYVLGLSGGAAAGALMAMLFAIHVGISVQHSAGVGAALGAAATVLLLFGLAHRSLRHLPDTPFAAGHRLILTGVMIASGSGALVTLALSLAPDAQLRGMIFWLLGDLEGSAFLLPAWIVLTAGAVWSILNAKSLNLLSRGESFAQLLGVPVVRLRIMVLCAASLATAAAVTAAGTIGFVGLVVPHAIRLVFSNDQRILLPASVLAGGSFLTIADLLARTAVAPTQLPVGVITALVGVPLFLWLLSRSRA
ncbi:FecCD family ABC transporter permease [Noviherbaspirillum massiliense]|uniref:FecCD family ABC transporter permease n=1 Tax=Noviherbaspirillum massiliense TaxID=1465823 RepID=UPI000314303F|nr:iron ABC transporter permease [Noviherbaspirillum massiliense]